MELYKFLWGALAWIAVVAVLWPINVPVIALAYKIQNGTKPLEIDKQELIYRSLFGAGALAFMSLGFILLDYFAIELTDLPSGPIHLIIFMGYLPSAAYLMVVSFAYTELTEGLGTFIIYLGLLLVGMFIVNAVTGLLNGPLDYAKSYLKEPK